MNKIFAIGDIHGAHIPLQQCLERSGFDYENDLLINLGDICDGWRNVYECVEQLLKCKHRIDIMGNHDAWFRHWLTHMTHPDMWSQGGKGTAQSYLRACGKDPEAYSVYYGKGLADYGRTYYKFELDPSDIPPDHWKFFMHQRLYYKDELDRLFVHAGFVRNLTLKENQQQDQSQFYWDRHLWHDALAVHKGESLNFVENFTEIFIGHTATIMWFEDESYYEGGILIKLGKQPITKPMHADLIWNLDTGAGSSGKLTIMDIDSKEYWQSDNVNEIYGDYKPRG